jgi:phosphohistidine phosphatase SixA
MSSSSKHLDAYLGSTAMRATQSTMQLASLVLGFDVVELWTEEGDGHLHCTYVHATEDIIRKYPDVIVGHYPNHKKEHKLSPMVTYLTRWLST